MDVEPKRVAFAGGALGVKIEKLRRGIVRALRSLALGAFPLAASQLVQRRSLGGRAAVTADEVQIRDGDVELRVVGVSEMQEFVRSVTEVERHESKIAADAVLLVDDRIAVVRTTSA